MIEEGSKRGKALVEKRQLFMEMSECERSAHVRFSLDLSAAAAALCASPGEVDIAPPTQVSARGFECAPCSCKRAIFCSHERKK